MNVTRDVIADLWPLYVDDVLSADSRALVDEALVEHPEWKTGLDEDLKSAGAVLAADVKPDEEVRMWNQIKKRLRTLHWLRMLALAFTAVAFGRIVQDTTWTNSPRRFVATAVLAVVCWVIYLVAVTRMKRVGE